MDLRERKYWIFDLDGTLTVAVHDFTATRRELDLPPGKPILEELATPHLPRCAHAAPSSAYSPATTNETRWKHSACADWPATLSLAL